IGQMPEWYMDLAMNGRDRRQRGNRDDKMAPHNTYPCAGDDKWIAIAVGTQSEWEALCGAMESPMGSAAWTRDAKFADQYSRWRNSTSSILISRDGRAGTSISRLRKCYSAQASRRGRCSTASRSTTTRIFGSGDFS